MAADNSSSSTHNLPTVSRPRGKSVISSYLDETLEIEGKVFVTGKLNINGHIRGTIESDGEILVGPDGTVKGTIHADVITISGMVEGKSIANRELEILAQGHFNGDLHVPKGGMVIHEGAIVEGTCHTRS